LTSPKKTSLSIQENKEVPQSEVTNEDSIKTIKSRRKNQLNIDTLVADILNRNIASLSRGITLVESRNAKHINQANDLLKKCLPYANKSIRIGITGVPGVGKSTFIEAFGNYLISIGKKVAVLAIDPSSSLSKGSILGDKTRMEHLVKNPNAFIRPSASGDSLGGVARKTRENIILCEAAGFDVIIVETVGVGQSETIVHSMVDFFLLLQITGAGDELQGIKRGIIEMADAIAINKADGNNLKQAKITMLEYQRALHLYPEKSSNWIPKTTICSALNNEGINDIWNIIEEYIDITLKNNFFTKKRNEQNKYWLIQTIENQLKTDFFNESKIKKELQNQLELINTNKTTPFAAAELLLSMK